MNIESLAKAYSEVPPLPEGGMAYGTAGFRAANNKLDNVCFKVGVFAACLSKHCGGLCGK